MLQSLKKARETSVKVQPPKETVNEQKEFTDMMKKITEHEGIDDLILNLKDKYETLLKDNERRTTEINNNILKFSEENRKLIRDEFSSFHAISAPVTTPVITSTVEKTAKKKKSYQKISTPEAIQQAVSVLRSKYPLFPKEFEDKLYTTDGDTYFVDFKKGKLEITDGGVVLKLINSLNK